MSKASNKIPALMAEAGFMILPLHERKKFLYRFEGKTWDEVVGMGAAGHSMLTAATIADSTATGWAVCLTATDPEKLVVLDVDDYGVSVEDAWARVSADTEMPPYTITASGGFHFWFRAPDDVDLHQLPSTVKLDGVGVDIRASREGATLLVLPGTLANNKLGEVGRYQAVDWPDQFPAGLPVMPHPIFTRIAARVTPATKEKRSTEVFHFLRLLRGLETGSLKRGDYNTTIAQVGQVLGRIQPGHKPDDLLAGEVLEILGGALEKGESFNETEAYQALYSGNKKGRSNAEKYNPATKNPMVTDVLAECSSLGVSDPWVVEVRSSSGKVDHWILGVGGSAKRRDKASRMVRIDKVDDALVSLASLGAIDLDVLSQSPLFVQAGWRRAFQLHLLATRGVDYMGVPPEAQFWEKCIEWAGQAIDEQLFLETWNSRHPGRMAFIAITHQQPPALCIMPDCQMTLKMAVGDSSIVRRIINKRFVVKGFSGLSNGKLWVVPLHVLVEEGADTGITLRVQDAYERFKRGGEAK